jgi:Holliday junction resolvasome RuvABC endonuclease subunit
MYVTATLPGRQVLHRDLEVILNILALDCATKTGWATLIDGQIESGVQDFSKKRGESPGMIFIRFNAWLRQAFGGTKFDIVAVEQAHHRGGYPTNLCIGMTTRVQEYAAYINAESMEVHTGTLKKATVGKGNANKQEIMAWFKGRMNREPITSDEADAYALLVYTMQELGEKTNV